MNCNENNPCMGVYGKCLDVKITNYCNGKCGFCIEKGGLETEVVSVNKLIEATNNLKNYQKVLILGGEPFLYNYLCNYIEGIREHKEEIYITTNGSAFEDVVLHRISKYLTAINISIHHYDEKINSKIIGTSIDFENIKHSIEILKSYGVNVRINTNLIKNGIDNNDEVLMMIMFAKVLGADSIRFAELHNCPKLFVSAHDIFDNINENPYCDGCEQTLNLLKGIETKVRLTCGIVNPLKDMPQKIEENKSQTKVMYTNSIITDGWMTKSGGHGDGCHRKGCH